MWILFALGASFFAGITAVFAKMGVEKVDSTLATALRTIVIFISSVIIVIIIGSSDDINKLDIKTIIFLILSGITTAALWLTYFKALSLADVSKVSPIDKTSIILTLILSNIFLKEKMTIAKISLMILILIGTYLMTAKGRGKKEKNNKWILYSFLTAIFTSLATIFGKIGIKSIDTNLAALIKTVIVLVIIWGIVFIKKKNKKIHLLNKKSWLYIFLSGLTTTLSWLCYFKALKIGETSMVFSIEKLSIVFAVIFSFLILKEKITKKSIIGLFLIIVAIIMLAFLRK